MLWRNVQKRFACGFCAVEHLTFNQGVHTVNPYAPVAQLVEHLTFNQGVRSSILRRSTTASHLREAFCFKGYPGARIFEKSLDKAIQL